MPSGWLTQNQDTATVANGATGAAPIVGVHTAWPHLHGSVVSPMPIRQVGPQYESASLVGHLHGLNPQNVSSIVRRLVDRSSSVASCDVSGTTLNLITPCSESRGYERERVGSPNGPLVV